MWRKISSHISWFVWNAARGVFTGTLLPSVRTLNQIVAINFWPRSWKKIFCRIRRQKLDDLKRNIIQKYAYTQSTHSNRGGAETCHMALAQMLFAVVYVKPNNAEVNSVYVEPILTRIALPVYCWHTSTNKLCSQFSER